MTVGDLKRLLAEGKFPDDAYVVIGGITPERLCPDLYEGRIPAHPYDASGNKMFRFAGTGRDRAVCFLRWAELSDGKMEEVRI